MEDVSFHSFEDPPDAFQLTITAPNHVPYVYVSASVTGIQENIVPYIDLYPNPVQDILHVDADLSGGWMQLYDINGRLLMEAGFNFGSNEMDISGYPAGPYFLRIRSDAGSGWFKVLLQ